MTSRGCDEESFFASPALDHAVSGMVAGTIATLCMNPLDLIKTRFQVNRTAFSATPPDRSGFYQRLHHRRWLFWAVGGKPGADILDALRGIVAKQGILGLYRGVVANAVGNASSWGLYFLFYTMSKEYMASSPSGEEPIRLGAGEHLLAATQSGVLTALLTNPIWVVKTRMFTTPPTPKMTHIRAPGAAGTIGAVADPGIAGTPAVTARVGAPPAVYHGLWDGLLQTVRTEGIGGLYKGVGLAVLGVSNGAIQFMAYEQLKQWRSASILQRRDPGSTRFSETQLDGVRLSNVDYTVISGASKLLAITLTYPYQVVRSRVQNHATAQLYPDVAACVVRTFRDEGVGAFYRGFVTNAVRIVPGTCVTFVAYENVTWALRAAVRRRDRAAG
ncbi:mitochondrial FAD carrier protein flx1 [Malassezia sp. CBS 17886]|nr:mitochondrial FAD carrier protein flx1 [Malassezia sp. CBS 17886]